MGASLYSCVAKNIAIRDEISVINKEIKKYFHIYKTNFENLLLNKIQEV